MSKRSIITFCLMWFSAGAFAQTTSGITLEKCFQLAEANYPLAAQKGILQSISDEQISRINAFWQPQATVNAQATYQSDVTHVPISFPGIDIPVLSKDQYKATLDVTQTLYDGGVTKQQRTMQQLSTAVETEKIDVDLYKLREKVSQLYFAVLIADKNIELIKTLQSELATQKDKLVAAQQFGTASSFQTDQLQAEIFKADQRLIEVQSAKTAAMNMLSQLTGINISASDAFATPEFTAQLSDTINERPELKLIQLQQDLLQQQSDFASEATLPKVALFAQGGYGKPGLNFLDDAFKFYYIGGIKFSYSLWNGNTKKYDAAIAQLNRQTLDLNRNAFLQSGNIQTAQYRSDIQKYEQLIASDTGIVALKQKLKAGATAQLDNGTLSAKDYISYVNDETEAKITMATHQMQLLSAQLNYLITLGKIQ